MMVEDEMQKAKRSGVQFEWKNLLIPLSLVTMIALWSIFRVPLWLLTLGSLWIPVYYILYPRVIRNRWLGFEKEFALRFQQGDHKSLLEFYRKQWLLRRFGPRAEMLGKLGLIYTALERYRDAELAFERAIDLTPAPYRERLYFNLANVKFELGKYENAAAIHRSLKPNSPYRHASQTQLALIDIHQGEHVEQAKKLLEQEYPKANATLKARIDEALRVASS